MASYTRHRGKEQGIKHVTMHFEQDINLFGEFLLKF